MNPKINQLVNIAKAKVPSLNLQMFPTHFSLSVNGMEVLSADKDANGAWEIALTAFLGGLLVGVNQNVPKASFFSLS